MTETTENARNITLETDRHSDFLKSLIETSIFCVGNHCDFARLWIVPVESKAAFVPQAVFQLDCLMGNSVRLGNVSGMID